MHGTGICGIGEADSGTPGDGDADERRGVERGDLRTRQAGGARSRTRTRHPNHRRREKRAGKLAAGAIRADGTLEAAGAELFATC